jgi:hypothetical protein
VVKTYGCICLKRAASSTDFDEYIFSTVWIAGTDKAERQSTTGVVARKVSFLKCSISVGVANR